MYHSENKQDFEDQTLQADLEVKYGPAIAQGIMDSLKRAPKSVKTPEYMDVKAMSELQERFRALAMQSVWRLREWRAAHVKTREKVSMQHNLIEFEGVFLERQCADAIKLYRLANRTYFWMHEEAMNAFAKPVLYNSMFIGKKASS